MSDTDTAYALDYIPRLIKVAERVVRLANWLREAEAKIKSKAADAVPEKVVRRARTTLEEALHCFASCINRVSNGDLKDLVRYLEYAEKELEKLPPT